MKNQSGASKDPQMAQMTSLSRNPFEPSRNFKQGKDEMNPRIYGRHLMGSSNAEDSSFKCPQSDLSGPTTTTATSLFNWDISERRYDMGQSEVVETQTTQGNQSSDGIFGEEVPSQNNNFLSFQQSQSQDDEPPSDSQQIGEPLYLFVLYVDRLVICEPTLAGVEFPFKLNWLTGILEIFLHHFYFLSDSGRVSTPLFDFNGNTVLNCSIQIEWFSYLESSITSDSPQLHLTLTYVSVRGVLHELSR